MRFVCYAYSCFDKGCPKKASKRTRQCRKVVLIIPNKFQLKLRIHIAVHLKSSLYGRGIMDSEFLLKFIGYFPEYRSIMSRTLLRFFWATFVETAVYRYGPWCEGN